MQSMHNSPVMSEHSSIMLGSILAGSKLQLPRCCCSGGKLAQPPATTDKVAAAISALVGPPQSAYLYRNNRDRLISFRGVHQGIDGKFIAKAKVGKRGALVSVGRFATMEAAGRAYDAAVYKYYGFRRLFNFPQEYAHLKPHSAEESGSDKQKASKSEGSVQLALQQ